MLSKTANLAQRRGATCALLEQTATQEKAMADTSLTRRSMLQLGAGLAGL